MNFDNNISFHAWPLQITLLTFIINKLMYWIVVLLVNKYRPIYIGKNQNKKNLGFLLYRLHCQKNT